MPAPSTFVPCLVAAALVALGCTDRDTALAHDAPPAAASTSPEASPTMRPKIGPEDLPPTRAAEREAAASAAAELEDGESGDALEPEDEASETGGEAEAPAAPLDPLAPILPEGPEPGTPEADAELEALLEESTLTQDEFNRGFHGKSPTLDGDQFVFGPGGRAKADPVLEVGSANSSSPALATKVEALARAESRKILGCYTMALGDDPKTAGSVTLNLGFNATGAVETVETEGGAGLGKTLLTCLRAVANTWSLADADNAKASVTLTLRTK